MDNQLLRGLSVLVVEDEFLIAMDVEQVCRDSGAVDVRVIGQREALTAAALDAPTDVVILDVKLGGEHTLEFARLLASRGIPFIFATGYGDLGALRDEFPGVAVVGKPYATAAMVDALAAATLGRRGLGDGG